MKFLVFVFLCITAVFAEPQRYNQFRENYNRAPYTPSGWRPDGPAFKLPERQQLPAQEYGAPAQQYGTPDQSYGPPEVEPEVTTTEASTTELPTTTEAAENQDDKENFSEQLKDGQQGAYYIYHPSGLLQRITYATKDDQDQMAYYAQIKYENVEPIKDPIYSYDADKNEFVRIARKI